MWRSMHLGSEPQKIKSLAQSYFTEWDQQMEEAVDICLEAHKDTNRKVSGELYAIHPVAVGIGAKENFSWYREADAIDEYQMVVPALTAEGKSDIVCACFLHDVLEDEGLDTGKWGPIIFDTMRRNTAMLCVHLCKRLDPWYDALNRQRRKYIDHDRLGRIPVDAKYIKLLDRLHNLHGYEEGDGFCYGPNATYLHETDALLEALRMGGDSDGYRHLSPAFKLLEDRVEFMRTGHAADPNGTTA